MRRRLLVSVEFADQYGLVGYKAIPTLLEPFWENLLTLVGTSFKAIERESGLIAFVVKFEVSPTTNLIPGGGYYIETRVDVGERSLIFHQKITEDDIVVANATTVVVLRTHTGRSVQIPDDLRRLLS